ncbi:helicase-related protein [Candidatus Uabimicrobium sp. HlEnr_7]|uniref:preprotein translocase subunit SecA n=1 Tax=Candidatus Uabimicrobium helgolandensis TaxID=3095367 RepID=UPI00355895B1
MQNLALTNLLYSISPKVKNLTSFEYRLVEEIKQQEKITAKLDDNALRHSVFYLKECIQKDKISDLYLLVKAFSLTREASWRALQKKHYDVQLLSGIVLANGGVAEMATGEGKTLTATLPIVLWALHNKGVHVATSNQYLAERDLELMKPVYDLLGLSSAVLGEKDTPQQKTERYAADITYGCGYTFGFDYLRDQLAIIHHKSPPLGSRFFQYLNGNKDFDHIPQMQRGHHFALVDELDSVLIDEARTPLVLSKKGENKNAEVYSYADEVAKNLEDEVDFTVDDKTKSLELTESGVNKITQRINSERIKGIKYPWSFYIRQSLRAHHLFRKDVDYVIEDNKVMIVDSFSGRKFADRSWNQGLHQAVQAKEHVDVSEENTTLGKITRQKYYRRYTHYSGMTGTATGSEKELWELYGLTVTAIPTRKTLQRKILSTRIFKDKKAKFAAIAERISEIIESKQPVLVGTKTIEDSEIVAKILEQKNISHKVLNAKHDEEEAEIVADAGVAGSVTIATNMAGRGTDIPLGEGVVEKGGLFVIAAERNDSTRIDQQLIGRCARQGQPGTAQFFISFEDDLIYNNLEKVPMPNTKDGELNSKYEKIFDKVQQKVETKHYLQRRQMQRYDNWIDELLVKVGKK